jgi:Inclusion body protein.
MKNLSPKETADLNILFVLDTHIITKKYPKPSLNKTKPTRLSNNVGQYAFCSGVSDIINGQGTNNITVFADPNGEINVRGTTIDQDSNNSILIYQIVSIPTKRGNNQFTPLLFCIKQAVQPNPDSTDYDGLPAQYSNETFISMGAKIPPPGKKIYRISFALYRLGVDGETQILYGYFCCTFIIHILTTDNSLFNR